MSETQTLIADLSKRPLLRYNQRVGLEEQQRHVEEMLKDPGVGGKDRGLMLREKKTVEKQLAGQSPKPHLSPEEKDGLATMERTLREELLQGAQTSEELRRNPAGAVARLQRYEKANKKKMLLWKNIRIQLEPDNSDPDLANFEQYRPERSFDNGASGFMVNAQIPGHFVMTPAAKANWPAEMPPQGTANSPLAQARKRERSPEQRAEFGARMKAAREAKKRAASGGV